MASLTSRTSTTLIIEAQRGLTKDKDDGLPINRYKETELPGRLGQKSGWLIVHKRIENVVGFRHATFSVLELATSRLLLDLLNDRVKQNWQETHEEVRPSPHFPNYSVKAHK